MRKDDVAIFLFHREFRLHDNTGLNAMAKSGKKIIPVFAFDPAQIDPERNKYFSNGAVQFMVESLIELDADMRRLGSRMIFMHGDPVKVLKDMLRYFEYSHVYSHEDNTPFADERDDKIKSFCVGKSISFVQLHDYDLYPYTQGLKDGRPYQVFTPYLRHCLQHLEVRPVDNFKLNRGHFVSARQLAIPGSKDRKEILKYFEHNPNINILPGTREGQKRLRDLKHFEHYNDTRDFFSTEDSTTHLSAYIKFGCVSIREVYWRVFNLYGINHGIIRELHWRSFYYRVAKYTDVLKGRAFKKQYEAVRWSRSKSDLRKFEQARTGVPLIDAAVRNTSTSCWLHNRLRMLTAMFATKDLGLHWTLPEKFLASTFVDYDASSTNGGIQWSASTGADPSVPFRTMSPWAQGKRYDPDALYIKKWIPQLRDVPAKHIHDWENQWQNYRQTGYPAPCVSHSKAVKRTLEVIRAGLR